MKPDEILITYSICKKIVFPLIARAQTLFPLNNKKRKKQTFQTQTKAFP